MKPLILMYVFFDINGDIKAITPNLCNIGDEFLSATFPISEVESFLNSSKNTFDYHIKSINGSYKIVKKVRNITYTKTLDSYLTKVDDISNSGTLKFINDTTNKLISIELDRDIIFNMNQELHQDTERVTDILFNSGPCVAYLTKKNNPYHLLFTFTFSPKDFLTINRLNFSYNGVYNNTSIYTKKLINGYCFKEE